MFGEWEHAAAHVNRSYLVSYGRAATSFVFVVPDADWPRALPRDIFFFFFFSNFFVLNNGRGEVVIINL